MINYSSPDHVDQLHNRAAAIKGRALTLDTSRTEPVTVGDIESGDILLSLNGNDFPFPFTISTVTQVGTYGVVLTATHGWFTPGRVHANDPAVRLVRDSLPYAFPDVERCAAANQAAAFLPVRDAYTLPCLTIAGVQVYAYLDPKIGAVRVSVDLDTPGPGLCRSDSTVPVRVDIGDSTVFDDSDTARATGKATTNTTRILAELEEALTAAWQIITNNDGKSCDSAERRWTMDILALIAEEVHKRRPDLQPGRLAQPNPSSKQRWSVLRRLVAHQYDGNATDALLELADVGDIAVNYLDREWFAIYLEDHYDLPLTDDAWQAIAAELGGYDKHVCDYAEPNVQNDFADQVLEAAGVLPDEDTDADDADGELIGG
ncbi:hypothetical protein GCM10009733_008230 [Nonomuraea maheshkhaliensis]|uniref:Uncharacterized protein n=1 Tax=Nonomuraea maheshkhaliensis TaxID=419590 RepID=A0ABP4QKG2_9ACTN